MFFNLLKSCAAIVGLLISLGVGAQDYPSKALRMIVPFPPGGVTDIVARAVAAKLSIELGQAVVVENRAGASGVIGAEAGARAPADGYTLVMGNISGSVALSDFCQKMALILLNNFCWELLNATEPEFSHQRGRALRGAGDLDGGMTLYPAFRSNS